MLNQPRPEFESASDWATATRVLVLQGGGALGSYQAGVYEALARMNLCPHWVTGISIGAINAALIVGNPPERRVERLSEFWRRVSSLIPQPPVEPTGGLRTLVNRASAAFVAAVGAPGFFHPNVINPMVAPAGAFSAISLYDTRPLRATLERLVDFDLINHGPVRLSVGAVNVLTGNRVVFDSAQTCIGPDHVMASGALPPGFPPVFVDGQPYWDGGLVSNSPLQFVLDEHQSEDLLVFQIDLFNARGRLPRDLLDVEERRKDIGYSSRTRMNTDMNRRIHQHKKALRGLLERLPKSLDAGEDVRQLRDLAQELAHEYATMIVQLIYRKQPFEGGYRDYEFSRQTMLEHWASGIADAENFARHGHLPRSRQPGISIIDPGRPSQRSDPVGAKASN